jgi:hypothetical protein
LQIVTRVLAKAGLISKDETVREAKINTGGENGFLATILKIEDIKV